MCVFVCVCVAEREKIKCISHRLQLFRYLHKILRKCNCNKFSVATRRQVRARGKVELSTRERESSADAEENLKKIAQEASCSGSCIPPPLLKLRSAYCAYA